MNDLGLLIIILAAVAVVLMVGALLLRRSQLRGALGTFDASICLVSGRWRMGVCRYAEQELEFMSLYSLSPIPRHRFRRSKLEIHGWREPQGAEATKLPGGWIVVGLEHGGDRFDLAMNYGAYTGLSAWLEAGPVVGIGTWR
ncbi:hypothetical protein GCM10022377_01300 [Zhihengliuella alba]|uniref:DUF2550 family protein n=1 Tax=Zhihengliuella alba TaxID=547018 RepID=A0ABP7CR85_9MICC